MPDNIDALLTLTTKELKNIDRKLDQLIKEQKIALSDKTIGFAFIGAPFIAVAIGLAFTPLLPIAVVCALIGGIVFVAAVGVTDENRSNISFYTELHNEVNAIIKTREQNLNKNEMTRILMSELTDINAVKKPARHRHIHVHHHSSTPDKSAVVNDGEVVHHSHRHGM